MVVLVEVVDQAVLLVIKKEAVEEVEDLVEVVATVAMVQCM